MARSASLEVALSGLQGISEQFTDPEDDFASVIFVESKQGEVGIVPAFRYMENDSTKELFFEAIMPILIRRLQVQRVVMVLSAWVLHADDDYFTNDEPRPAEHPDRMEMVLVVEMTGAGVETDMYAFINRDPRGESPPTLGEFHEHPKSATHTGRAIESILETLKEVQGMMNDPDYEKLIGRINSEMQIEVSFKTKDISESVQGQMLQMMNQSAELPMMVVEIPIVLVASLCKAATIGVMAGAAMGIDAPIQNPDGTPVNEESLQEAFMQLFENAEHASHTLSAAMYTSTYLSDRGLQKQEGDEMESFLAQLNDLPTYEGEVQE